MRCNWRRWLWGVIPLLMLAWVAVQAEHDRIEADLYERAVQALSRSGMGWAATQVVGRDVVLSGLAGDDAELPKAAEAVRDVWGVRVVDNRAELLPRVETYDWSVRRRGQRIRIRGHVPNRATRQAIIGVAKANFPGFEVVDRMTTRRGVPSADTWLGGVGFALKQLAALKRGDVHLEGLGMRIAGEVEDVAGYRAVKSALANGLPKGIKLTNDQVTAPVVSPFTWSAKFADGRLELFGYVTSEAVRADLVAAVKGAFTSTVLADHMEPGEGAPQGWTAVAAASIRELAQLEGGSAELKDIALTISGLAADKETAEAVRTALRAAMPAAIKFIDQIKTRDPTPPPPAPAPPAAKELEPTIARAPDPPAPTPPATPEPAAPTPAPAASEPAPAASEPAPPTASQKDAPPPTAPAPAASEPALPPVANRTDLSPPPTAPAPPVGEPAPAIASRADPPRPTTTTPPASEPAPAIASQPAPPPTGAPALARAKDCEDTLRGLATEGRIRFRFASAKLNSTSRETLDKLAAAAKRCPGTHIEVGGHASAEGSGALNRRLSLKRARSVVAYLVEAGVDAGQLEPVGYGATQPVAPNDNSETMARNRRIDFAVRPK